jgi:hypothetical protein
MNNSVGEGLNDGWIGYILVSFTRQQVMQSSRLKEDQMVLAVCRLSDGVRSRGDYNVWGKFGKLRNEV